MGEYDFHYELEELLAQDPRLIEAILLYQFSDRRMYSAAMDRAARPLPDGTESPFSFQGEGSSHSILLGTQVHLQGLLAHQFNAVPEAVWIRILRLLGVEREAPTYPVIELTFYKNTGAIRSGQRVDISIGTTIASRLRQSDLAAIVVESGRMLASESQVTLRARLNRLGRIPESLKAGDLSIMTESLSGIDRVENNGVVINPGRDLESLKSLVLNARTGIRTGNLAKFQVNGQVSLDDAVMLGRCVTPGDFYFYTEKLGASKTNVLPRSPHLGILYEATTVVIYPPDQTLYIQEKLTRLTLAEDQVHIRPAEIIPIDGQITFKATAGLSDLDAQNAAKRAIITEINPPNGRWGDPNLTNSIATALEEVEGIFAVPSMELKHSLTNQPLSEMEIKPWNLFQVQNSIQLIVNR